MQPTNKVMPHIIVSNGQEALNWYRDVLGAEITHVMPGPGRSSRTLDSCLAIQRFS
ncbi:MAG: hypothetical protein IPP40_14065 [bacterium]|nr:hypothetical protein [bacterium]